MEASDESVDHMMHASDGNEISKLISTLQEGGQIPTDVLELLKNAQRLMEERVINSTAEAMTDHSPNGERNEASRKRKKEDVLQWDLCTSLIAEGWRPAFEMQKCLHEYDPATWDESKFRSRMTLMDLFKLLFPTNIIHTLAAIVNRRSTALKKKSWRCRKSHIYKFLGLLLLMENSGGNLETSKLAAHWKLVLDQHLNNKPPLSYKRFLFIRTNLSATIPEISQISKMLMDAANSLLLAIAGITPDETMIGYHVSPVMRALYRKLNMAYPGYYIPRKKAANGMIIWTMATYVICAHSKHRLPFFVEMFPHLRSGDGGPPAAITFMAKGWRHPKRAVVVVDSGIGSKKLMLFLASLGIPSTMSISISQVRRMADALQSNLPINTHRCIIHPETRIVFGVATRECDSNGTKKFVISNNFKYKYHPDPPLAEQPQQRGPSELQLSAAQLAAASTTVEPLIPVYTIEALSALTTRPTKSTDPLKQQQDNLVAICKRHNLPVGGKKEDLISRILGASATAHTQGSLVEQMFYHTTRNYSKERSAIHESYAANFNAVDLGDRYFSKTTHGHTIKTWTVMMLLALLRLQMVNLYVASLNLEYRTYLQLRTEMALALCNYECDDDDEDLPDDYFMDANYFNADGDYSDKQFVDDCADAAANIGSEEPDPHVDPETLDAELQNLLRNPFAPIFDEDDLEGDDGKEEVEEQ